MPENAVRGAEGDFRSAEQDVENVPSDIGGGLRGAASWIGDKFGGVEGDADKAEGEFRGAEGDAQNFDNSMDSSFNNGENQGRQEGGW